MTNLDNWEYITSAKSINKIDYIILAFLILQDKYTLHKWVLYNNLSNDISLNTSDFGYLNNSLVMD